MLRHCTVLIRLLTMYVAITCHAIAGDNPPEDILRQVDRYRMPLPSFEAAIRITPFKDGQPQEPGTYLIRGAGHNQVLVEATSFDQMGQKFLTTDSGLFFYAPRTKRAIRLTPLQSLRGQASIGDIARINFDNDYIASATALPPQSCPENDCIALQLNSKNSEASYTRIVLVVRQRHGQYLPVTALLYVNSGKLLKIARFDTANGNLPPTTRYIDPSDPTTETRVVFEKLTAARFPANMFNPRTLEQ